MKRSSVWAAFPYVGIIALLLCHFCLSLCAEPLTYGCAWNADGLANLEIGKYPGRTVSYRFRAEHSVTADKVMVYLVYSTGYGKGDGGRILLELQSDDGTSNHYPSGTVLASAIVTDPKTQWNRLFVFDKPTVLESGRLYHLVFSNVGSDPVHNYVSIDNLFNERDAAGCSRRSATRTWRSCGNPRATAHGKPTTRIPLSSVSTTSTAAPRVRAIRTRG